MSQRDFSELSDQELLAIAKKMKSSPIINAVLIGFMIGVIIFSIWKNTVGLFTLIPLIFAFKVLNQSKKSEGLEKQLKARNLK